MDIGKAFTFVFEDEDWVTKVLIGIGIVVAGVVLFWLAFIPTILAALLLSGYSLEITRRVIRGDAEVLPAWDDWGQLLIDGLQVVIIAIVYALPMIVVGLCLSTPLSMAKSHDGAVAFFSFAVSCFNFLWSIVLSLTLPAAIGKFAAEGELASAFHFGDVLALIRDNLTTYVITAVLVWVTSIISGLGLLFCLVGVFFTGLYAELINGHLFGQAYLEATGQTPLAAGEEAAP